MFTDAFGEENLFSDKRHVPVGRASVSELTQKIFRCGKVTRRYCTVNAIPDLAAHLVPIKTEFSRALLFGFRNVAQKFPQWFANRQNLTQVSRRKIWPGGREAGAFT